MVRASQTIFILTLINFLLKKPDAYYWLFNLYYFIRLFNYYSICVGTTLQGALT